METSSFLPLDESDSTLTESGFPLEPGFPLESTLPFESGSHFEEPEIAEKQNVRKILITHMHCTIIAYRIQADSEPPPAKKKFTLPNDKHTTKLPVPFPLPQNYPLDVEYSLRTKKMTPNQFNRFVHHIARAIFSIKCYPTGIEYAKIAEQVITEYPFLSIQAGNHYVRSRIIVRMVN